MDITMRKTLLILGILIFLAGIPAQAAEVRATLGTRCVPPSSDISIPIILSDIPQGVSGLNVSVTMSNPDVAQIVNVSAPSWASLSVTSAVPANEVWIKAADLQRKVNANDQDVPVGIVTVRSLKKGDVVITITSTKVDDDQGNTYFIPIKSQQLCFGSLSDTIPPTLSPIPVTSGTKMGPKTTYASLPVGIPVLCCILVGILVHGVIRTGKK